MLSIMALCNLVKNQPLAHEVALDNIVIYVKIFNLIRADNTSLNFIIRSLIKI